MMRRSARLAAAAAVIFAGALLGVGCVLERILNRVSSDETLAVSARAAALHERAFVADLHADSLLWGRDLTRRSDVGLADLPRLREGGVALQVFTVVTRVPWTVNIERNRADAWDLVTALAVTSGWPRATWTSRLERALFQGRRLEDAAARDGKLRIVRTQDDLAALVREHERDAEVVGGILGIEGAHALDGEVANLDRLVGAGFRSIGLVHFFDNEFAGSAHGDAKGGLTAKGRELVSRMEAAGVAVDLAHASSATIADVLAVSNRPVLVSHTGVRGTCDNSRNLSDAEIEAIAARGGVIGIGFWDTAVCGRSAGAIAGAIAYAVDRVGGDHVALGSDFDGAVRTPFDAAGLPVLTQAMLEVGLPPTTVRKVLGGNVRRLFGEILPAGPAQKGTRRAGIAPDAPRVTFR